MKKIATLLLLVIGISAHASNFVFVPDSLFRVYINQLVPGSVVGDSLDISNVGIQAIDSVNVYGHSLASVEGLEYFTSLRVLIAANNQISYLPVLSSTVNYINIDSNQVFLLQHLPASLHYLYCSHNRIVEIDSFPSGLLTFDCRSNNLLCMPGLPNSVVQLLATQNYMSCLPNLPTAPGFTSDIAYNGISYDVCTGNQCSRYTTISGYAYLDLNHNGIIDSGEPPLSSRIIRMEPLGQLAETDNYGHYTLSGNPGLIETLIPTPIAHATVTPDTATILLNTPLSDTANVNFGYWYLPSDTISDVKVLGTEVIPAVPGFNSAYNITVTNQGTRVEQGRLVFVLSSLFTYASSSPAASISGDTLIWNFSGINPGTSLYYNVKLNVLSSDVVGTHFQMPAYVSIVRHDSVPANNLATISDSITRTYPHTNKTVTPAYYDGTNFDAGDYFTYTITFQNEDVMLKHHAWIIDSLNPLFDMSTIMVVAASADYRITIDGNLLRVDFDSINLPDSAQSQVGSHGFFTFMIRPLTANFLGTIHNEAVVYLDSVPISAGTGSMVCFSGLTLGHYTNPETFNYCTSNISGSATVVARNGSPPYVYSWNTGSHNYVDTGLTTGYYYVTVTDQCIRTAVAIVYVDSVFGRDCNTWLGHSPNWFSPSNWSAGYVPAGCGYDAYIPPGMPYYPVLSANASAGKLNILPGGYLDLNGFKLSVCSNLIVGGVFTGNGTLTLDGTSGTPQNISGTFNVNELEINNTGGGVVLSNGVSIRIHDALDLHNGNFDVTRGTVTLTSNSVNQNAIIDNFSSGYSGSITGSVKAERYYSASLTYDQHYIGSPVNSPAVSQLGAYGSSGFVADSACSETHLAANSPYGNLFALDQSHGSTCSLDQWKVISTGNMQNALGYSWLSAGSGVLTLSGTPNLNSSYSIAGLINSGWSNQTLQNHTQISGWQLVSNPYLATLNPSSIGSGFDGQIQVWQANGPFAGTYQSAIVGGGASIAPFQAFMIHKTSNSGTATFTVNGSDRSRTAQTFYQQSANELKIIAANNANGLLDQTTVAFNGAASDSFDAQYDAMKLAGSLNRHTIYSLNNGIWMARNVLHDLAETTDVAVGFEPGVSGNYTFSFEGVNSFDATSYIYLEDKLTNTMHDARSGDYNFNANATDNRDRFVLHFTPPVQFNSVNGTCFSAGVISIQQPGNAVWNYSLTDSSNAIISAGILSESQPVSVAVTPATYALNLVAENGNAVTKFITVDGPQMIIADFSLSADTVQATQGIVFSAHPIDGASYLWDFGNGISNTGANVSVTYPQPGIYSVVLTVTGETGCTSTATKSVTVVTAAGAAGLTNTGIAGSLNIWSSNNVVYVDFTKQQHVDASVIIYNVLGQEISIEKVTGSIVYKKPIDNITAAYMIVRVKENDVITTRKVFIENYK